MMSKLLKTNTSLTSLNLASDELFGRAFLKAVIDNVHVLGNRITSKGAKMLLKGLKNNSSLISLNLGSMEEYKFIENDGCSVI